MSGRGPSSDRFDGLDDGELSVYQPTPPRGAVPRQPFDDQYQYRESQRDHQPARSQQPQQYQRSPHQQRGYYDNDNGYTPRGSAAARTGGGPHGRGANNFGSPQRQPFGGYNNDYSSREASPRQQQSTQQRLHYSPQHPQVRAQFQNQGQQGQHQPGHPADFLPDVRRAPPRDDTLRFLEEVQRNPQQAPPRRSSFGVRQPTTYADQDDEPPQRRRSMGGQQQQKQRQRQDAQRNAPNSVDRRTPYGGRQQQYQQDYYQDQSPRGNGLIGISPGGYNMGTPMHNPFPRMPGNHGAAQAHPFPTPVFKPEAKHEVWDVLYVSQMYRHTKLKKFQNGTFKHYKIGGKTVLLDAFDNPLETAFFPKGISEGMCLDIEKYYVEVDCKRQKPKKQNQQANAANGQGSESPPLKRLSLPKRSTFKPPSFVPPRPVVESDDEEEDTSEPPRPQGGFDVSRFEEPRRQPKKRERDDRDRDERDEEKPARRRYRNSNDYADDYDNQQRGGGGGRSGYQEDDYDRRRGSRGGNNSYYRDQDDDRSRGGYGRTRSAGRDRHQDNDGRQDDRSPGFRGARYADDRDQQRESPGRYEPRGNGYVLVRDESDTSFGRHEQEDGRRSEGRYSKSGGQSRRSRSRSSPARYDRRQPEQGYQDDDRRAAGDDGWDRGHRNRDEEDYQERYRRNSRRESREPEQDYGNHNDGGGDDRPREPSVEHHEQQQQHGYESEYEDRPKNDDRDGYSRDRQYSSPRQPRSCDRYEEEPRAPISPSLASRNNNQFDHPQMSSPEPHHAHHAQPEHEPPLPEEPDFDKPSLSDEEEERAEARRQARKKSGPRREMQLIEDIPPVDDDDEVSDNDLPPPDQVLGAPPRSNVLERLLQEKQQALGLRNTQASESLTPNLNPAKRRSSPTRMPASTSLDGLNSKENVSPGTAAPPRYTGKLLVEESPERPPRPTGCASAAPLAPKPMSDDIED